MAKGRGTNTWLCISCGYTLGLIYGGELNIDGQVRKVRTSGPNLVVYCPECSSQKTFFTSDPVVRAVYQLVTSVAEVGAKAMVKTASEELNLK